MTDLLNFRKRLGIDDLNIGISFLVWNVAKAEVVAIGIVTERDVLYDDGYERCNISYNTGEGDDKLMPLRDWGIWGSSPKSCITVGTEYLDKLDELPRLPRLPAQP